MQVLLITGGISSERKISLISGKQVKNALVKNSHNVRVYDLKKGYKGIKKLSKGVDVIFPVLHGEEGEGGKLHKFLASLNKPFVGGDWESFKQGWYKIPFKKFCDKSGINTSPWKIVKDISDVLDFGLPCVVKSSNGGSSREVAILNSTKNLNSSKVQGLLKSGDQLLVEQYLVGIELTVAILGKEALPVLEIIPPEGKWFDYKNKYSGETKEIPNAPSLSKSERKLVEKTALAIHQKLNMGDYSRIDFIFADGKPYVLEINTIPGLTPTSLFPKAALASGLNFNELVKKLIFLAIERFREEKFSTSS